MHQVAIVAGLTHVLFMGLFYALGAHALAAVNLGSTLLFAASYFCLRKRFNLMASSLIVVEILAHAALAVRAVGWDSGFHYYLLLFVPIAVISPIKKAIIKPILVGFVFALYLALDFTMRDIAPYDVVSKQTLTVLRCFNITVAFALLTYLSAAYLKIITKTEAKLLMLATTDPLTHLHNRRSMMEMSEREVKQRQQHGDPLAFVLADIDHFKAINDQHGHAAGDAVLTAVSDVLRQAVREHDKVARWGGEEFLILMPHATLDAACAMAERLRQQVTLISVPFEGKDIKVSMTFGVSRHKDAESVDSAISRADLALYRGKQSGRNQVAAEAI